MHAVNRIEKTDKWNHITLTTARVDDLLSQAVKSQWSPVAFLDELLRWELERQNERRITQALRIAHLPTGQTLSNFDFAFQPSIQRGQVQTLGACQWVAEHRTLLVSVPRTASFRCGRVW